MRLEPVLGKRLVFSEKQCSRAVKLVLTSLGADWYSTEVGYVLQTDRQGRPKPRAGGTRTTPGIPDIISHAYLPGLARWEYLTVEVKGHTTGVEDEQWAFAEMCAVRGFLHFIVRSPDELLTGLAYMEVLPERMLERVPHWLRDQWPENVNLLPYQWASFRARTEKDLLTALAPSPPIPRNRRRERSSLVEPSR